jgi:hypothetical protein
MLSGEYSLMGELNCLFTRFGAIPRFSDISFDLQEQWNHYISGWNRYRRGKPDDIVNQCRY